MNVERQRQQAEDSRERVEEERQKIEKQRHANEHRREVSEKPRETGEQLRGIARTGERLVVEYSTRALLTRIEGVEAQLSHLASRLGRVEALLHAMQAQVPQRMKEKE